MKQWLRFVIILWYTVLGINPGKAQRMIFSGDSVVVSSCEMTLNSIDTIHVYNNTDQEMYARWELVYAHHPQGGNFWLIFEPNHFLPSPGGNVTIEPRDTVWLIFYMFHQFPLNPGDSALLRIKVFDRQDSTNTSKFLTAIQYCPLQTSNAVPPADIQLQVFPNPIIDEVTIKIPEALSATSLILYALTGEVIRQWPLPDHEITLSMDGFPRGLYFAGVESQGQVVGITKLVLVE